MLGTRRDLCCKGAKRSRLSCRRACTCVGTFAGKDGIHVGPELITVQERGNDVSKAWLQGIR
jgi:hypothetical protein